MVFKLNSHKYQLIIPQTCTLCFEQQRVVLGVPAILLFLALVTIVDALLLVDCQLVEKGMSGPVVCLCILSMVDTSTTTGHFIQVTKLQLET